MKKERIYYIVESPNIEENFEAYENYKEALKVLIETNDKEAMITEITEEENGSSWYQVITLYTEITNLKKFRLKKGLTQEQLSKLSDVSLRMIQKYETKEKNINVAEVMTVKKLANALEVKIEDLLEIFDI